MLSTIAKENIFTDLFTEIKAESENWRNFETIMTDKSFVSRNAFAACFPNAHINLCVFHVIQIFHRQVTTKKCELTDAQTKEAKKIPPDMVYANLLIQYDHSYRDLRNLRSEKLMRYSTPICIQYKINGLTIWIKTRTVKFERTIGWNR